jgi:hypothetical protein
MLGLYKGGLGPSPAFGGSVGEATSALDNFSTNSIV